MKTAIIIAAVIAAAELAYLAAKTMKRKFKEINASLGQIFRNVENIRATNKVLQQYSVDLLRLAKDMSEPVAITKNMVSHICDRADRLHDLVTFNTEQFLKPCFSILNEQKIEHDAILLAKKDDAVKREDDIARIKTAYLHIIDRIEAGENLSNIAKSLSDGHCKIKTSELSAFCDAGNRLGLDQEQHNGNPYVTENTGEGCECDNCDAPCTCDAPCAGCEQLEE